MSAVPQDFSARPRASRMSRNMMRAIVSVVAIVVLGSIWILLRPGSAPVVAKQEPAPVPLELAAADVATVAASELTRVLPLSGSLAPLLQTTVKSRVSGEVLEVLVREGQAVKRGDLLARIDTRNLQAQLDSQQAALEKARADLALAKLNRDNSQALLTEHYISQNAYDSAASTYAASVASAKLAEAQVRQAQLSVDFAAVRAPFDGVIASRTAQPGENVSPDSPLLTMVDLSRLELQAPAPAAEIPGVHAGQIAKFRVDGFGSRQFEGKVVRINPMTEAGSRSIMLYLAVDNTDGALKSGMFAQGELALDPSMPRNAVPLAAVHTDTGVPYVYAYADGKLNRRTLTLGLQSPEKGLVEVRDGLAPGDIVVVAKLIDIKDGTPAMLHVAGEPSAAVPATPDATIKN